MSAVQDPATSAKKPIAERRLSHIRNHGATNDIYEPPKIIFSLDSRVLIEPDPSGNKSKDVFAKLEGGKIYFSFRGGTKSAGKDDTDVTDVPTILNTNLSMEIYELWKKVVAHRDREWILANDWYSLSTMYRGKDGTGPRGTERQDRMKQIEGDKEVERAVKAEEQKLRGVRSTFLKQEFFYYVRTLNPMFEYRFDDEKGKRHKIRTTDDKLIRQMMEDYNKKPEEKKGRKGKKKVEVEVEDEAGEAVGTEPVTEDDGDLDDEPSTTPAPPSASVEAGSAGGEPSIPDKRKQTVGQSGVETAKDGDLTDEGDTSAPPNKKTKTATTPPEGQKVFQGIEYFPWTQEEVDRGFLDKKLADPEWCAAKDQYLTFCAEMEAVEEQLRR